MNSYLSKQIDKKKTKHSRCDINNLEQGRYVFNSFKYMQMINIFHEVSFIEGLSSMRCNKHSTLHELRREKTGLRGCRPVATQTDLYSHRSRLEA